MVYICLCRAEQGELPSACPAPFFINFREEKPCCTAASALTKSTKIFV